MLISIIPVQLQELTPVFRVLTAGIANISNKLFLAMGNFTDIYTYIYIYNPMNNFSGLSLNKTDHVVQIRAMVIRRYPPSDLISVV